MRTDLPCRSRKRRLRQTQILMRRHPVWRQAASGETLCADTEYVLEEADIVRGTTVETSWKIPHKYIGMNRENFLETMELYAAHPPLSEIERGFVGLEVLSFPGKK